ncbi:MAG: helix-turn-helix domain-containing protein [Cyclobacteriaceae bacterium]
MPAAIITTDELREFKVELLEEIRTILSESEPVPNKWLRSAEVRKLLKISPGTLQNLRVNGTLPYTKVGGVIFYDYQDILNVFEENKRH